MRKTLILSFIAIIFLSMSTVSSASVISGVEGSYHIPDGYGTLGQIDRFDLNHDNYYYWSFNDYEILAENSTIQIVFRGIYNYIDDEIGNVLNVYMIDGNTNTSVGWRSSGDHSWLDRPDWSAWTHLGSWSYPIEDDPGTYPDGRYDVAFILDLSAENMEAWQYYLTNGGGFTIGIDPDCHFYGDKLGVYGPAPVPEPTTLILLGSGLIGLAGFRKKAK